MFSFIMSLIRPIFSLLFIFCITPLFSLISLASYINPPLPRDFSLTQQVNGSLNPLSFVDNVKEGIYIVRRSYPGTILYYIHALPQDPDITFINFHEVENWRIELHLLISTQYYTDSICIISSPWVWGQWGKPFETSKLPTPPFPGVPPVPLNLGEVVLDPITAWDKARAKVSSIDPCAFMGLRKPAGNGRDPSPFQTPEIMWTFRFTRPYSWVYVGAETGQVKLNIELI